jgi:hypothetical protein
MIDPSAAPDPPPGFPDLPRDWFESWVRFFFGAILGALFGMWIWLRLFPLNNFGWIALPVGALVFGFVAARRGDSFWRSLRNFFL